MRFRVLAGAVCALGLMATPAVASNVIVQGTADVKDAGLLADVIAPGFQAAYPQYTLQYVSVGTGQAITNAEAGAGDALVVHAPTLEAGFVAGGFSAEPFGRAIFYSDYVIIGPASDPAHVLGGAAHDAVHAYELIAAAGAAGTADFVSRGDNSGTNTEEKTIWAATTGVSLNTKNEPGDPGTTTNPSWYHKASPGSQAGMVQLADACPFASGACYAITDRGTFNRLVASGAVHLQVVADKNTADARGGQYLLTNLFHLYLVNPAKFPAGTINADGARAFADYLVSPAFQALLASYPTTSDPAFFADAAPHIGLTAPIATNAFAGKNVGLSLAVASVAPGAAPMTGAVVHVLRTIGTGTPTDIAQGAVDGNGFVTIPFAINRTASYTASVDPFQDLQGATLAVGSVNATATVKLVTAKTSGHRVLVTGTFTPTSLQVHPRLSLYSKRTTGGWHVIAKISATTRGTFSFRSRSLAYGGLRIYVRYTDDAGVVTPAVSSQKHVTLKATKTK